jgi:hypothetical protein
LIFLAGGGTSTIYIKVTSGTSNLNIPHSKIATIQTWTSSTNAPRLGGDLSLFTNLNYLQVTGTNTLSGSVTNLTRLTYLYVSSNTTLSGSITGLTKLTYLRVGGTNTLTGSIAALTALTYVDLSTGSTTISGSIAALTLLGTLNVAGTNTLTGSFNALASLTYVKVSGSNTISGDLKLISTNLTYFSLNLCAVILYTAGGSFANIPTSSSIIRINPSAGYGLTTAMVDQLIIDINTTRVAGRAINVTLQGSNQTKSAASTAARNAIIADGGTCYTN